MAIERVGIFLPVSEVFPDTKSDFETFKSLLGNLSRTDSLFWCARLNLIISDPEATHIKKQQAGLSQFFTQEEINKVNSFVKKNGGAERITVFFRGQILELVRWITLYCHDFPEDGIPMEVGKALATVTDVKPGSFLRYTRSTTSDEYALTASQSWGGSY